ncbi:MAG: molybdenum cofactor guanylyltransferase [Deinococcales bacterium]
MGDPRHDPGAAARQALTLETLTGAVLCGGRSTRFGTDKALHLVAGRTLLGRVLASLEPARERLLIGRPYPVEGARHVPDLRPGLGPLAGLETALTAASERWVALAACDLPCLTPAFWRLLCSRAAPEHAVVVRGLQGRLEPLAALYPRSALPRVRARLDRGQRDLQGLLQELSTVEVEREVVEAVCGPAVLHNVNRPGDAHPGADPCSG